MNEKFLQPADGMHIVSRSGSGTRLAPEAIEAGRKRIRMGEDPAIVAADLAAEDVALGEGFDNEVKK